MEDKYFMKNIKLFEDFVNEAFSAKRVESVIKKTYPQIVKDLGGEAKKVEVHSDIYTRLDAVNVEDLMEENNPSAEYDPHDDKIYIYYTAMDSVEEIIRSLLHEHTHTLQDQKKFKKLYDDGYEYSNHPYELEALDAEKNWKNYL